MGSFHDIKNPVNLVNGVTLEERVNATDVDEIFQKLLNDPDSALCDVKGTEKLMYAYRFTTRYFYCKRLYDPEVIDQTPWIYVGEPYSFEQLRKDLSDISENIIADINGTIGTEEQIKIYKEGFGLLILDGTPGATNEYICEIRPSHFRLPEKCWVV